MAHSERDRSKRSWSSEAEGQLGSSRSFLEEPGQLRGPRARIVQGRATRRCNMSAACFVGIDVSQGQFDVGVRPGTGFTVPHDESGIATVVEHLQQLRPTLIVLEATGGIEVK